MALFLAVAWAAAANLIAFGFGALARRAATRQDAGASYSAVRKLIKLSSIVNLFVATAAAVGVAFLVVPTTSFSARLIAAGLAFMAGAVAGEWLIGHRMYRPYETVRPDQLTSRAFRFRLIATALSIALPIGVTMILIGSIGDLAHTDVGQRGSTANAIAFVLALMLWVVQWSAIKLVLLPGRPADFPMPDWEEDVKRLAERMGTRLTDLLILRTGRSRIAGAYALGGGRIAITDDLLAALSKEEFMAVMAHELKHFTQRRKTTLFACAFVVGAGGAAALSVWAASAGVIPMLAATSIATLSALVPLWRLTKLRALHEDEADLAAIEQIGAMPLMCALAKTYAVNGRLGDSTTGSIHRGLRNRLSLLAARGRIPASAVADAVSSGETFDLAGAQVSFSSQWKGTSP